MTVGYPRVKEIVEQDLGSALIYLNSHAAHFQNPDIRPYLDKYVRGSNGYDAVNRVKVMKLIWDAIGSEFGSRHELYEQCRGFSGTQPWARAVGPVADNLYFAAPRMHAPTVVITTSGTRVFPNVSTVGYSLGARARGHGRRDGDGIVRASTGQSASWAHDA
jgi:hypothetical protein